MGGATEDKIIDTCTDVSLFGKLYEEDEILEDAEIRQAGFFSLGRVQNKEKVRTGVLVAKNKMYRICF